MSTKQVVTSLIVLLIVTAACTKPATPSPTPTLNTQATEAALGTLAAQNTQSAEQTAQAIQSAQAMQTADAQATLDAQASQVAQATQNAAATATQKVLNSQATQTQSFFNKQTSTAESILRETQQAEPLFEWVQKLFNEGISTTTEGKYFRVPDFNQSVAQLGQGFYWDSGFSANNFLLSASVALSSGSDKANWQDSSCGFIFGEENNRNYDLADVAMDGNIYMWNCRGGSCKAMAVKKYGPPMIPNGKADVTLMVFEKHIHFYVDGQEIVSATDLRYVEGNIAYLMRSGTNKDFGTRCQMTNIGLWMYP
jgi:hypothetical protein